MLFCKHLLFFFILFFFFFLFLFSYKGASRLKNQELWISFCEKVFSKNGFYEFDKYPKKSFIFSFKCFPGERFLKENYDKHLNKNFISPPHKNYKFLDQILKKENKDCEGLIEFAYFHKNELRTTALIEYRNLFNSLFFY